MGDIIQDIIQDIPFERYLKHIGNRKVVVWGKGVIGEMVVKILRGGV